MAAAARVPTDQQRARKGGKTRGNRGDLPRGRLPLGNTWGGKKKGKKEGRTLKAALAALPDEGVGKGALCPHQRPARRHRRRKGEGREKEGGEGRLLNVLFRKRGGKGKRSGASGSNPTEERGEKKKGGGRGASSGTKEKGCRRAFTFGGGGGRKKNPPTPLISAKMGERGTTLLPAQLLSEWKPGGGKRKKERAAIGTPTFSRGQPTSPRFVQRAEKKGAGAVSLPRRRGMDEDRLSSAC